MTTTRLTGTARTRGTLVRCLLTHAINATTITVAARCIRNKFARSRVRFRFFCTMKTRAGTFLTAAESIAADPHRTGQDSIAGLAQGWADFVNIDGGLATHVLSVDLRGQIWALA